MSTSFLPGWQPLLEACTRHYPDQIPPMRAGSPGAHYGTRLDCVLAFRALRPVPHWLFVSAGLSDIWAASPGEDGKAGMGFELTFRLADPFAENPDSEPPRWPVNLLSKLGSYAFGYQATLEPADFIDVGAAFTEGTEIRHLGVIEDPELGTVQLPGGKAQFLQLIGLTDDDLQDLMNWQPSRFLDLYQEVYPGGITHLDRTSLRGDARLRARIETGIAKESRGTEAVHAQQLRCMEWAGKLIVTLNLSTARGLVAHLERRFRIKEGFSVTGKDHEVQFAAGRKFNYQLTGNKARITLPTAALADIRANLQTVGRHEAPTGLHWHVVEDE
ncbi:suppressor of fused domain protein [Buchananella hordeovulneris]|uniref:suppressor of fused domain protein n=1 Tax=Buchananella hordeovulneris TaxID=52770 RepID=UPI0026DA941C|nr:suppressor of fused domain protein [Buchananella hordeovulneris]MDO5081698.1 suppressor of fused domain protein [Buchananella hordeovulneris]